LDFLSGFDIKRSALARSAGHGAPAAPSPKRCCNSMDAQGKSVLMIAKQCARYLLYY
jgi:hypothetical protein